MTRRHRSAKPLCLRHGYLLGWCDAFHGEPLFPDASSDYAAGWCAYWTSRGEDVTAVARPATSPTIPPP